jgi:hypothetical protein
MKYMLLIYTNPEAAAAGEVDYDVLHKEYMSFTERIIASGELVAGDPLEGVDTATTVRLRGGKTSTTDGPFAETKETLGGYYIVDVKDLDRALALAAEIPDAQYGSVEVRPVRDMS